MLFFLVTIIYKLNPIIFKNKNCTKLILGRLSHKFALSYMYANCFKVLFITFVTLLLDQPLYIVFIL